MHWVLDDLQADVVGLADHLPALDAAAGRPNTEAIGMVIAARIFVDALELFGIGYSWGGYESLAIPFDPKSARSATPRPPAGWNPDDKLGVRLSIGLEDPGDLMTDLDRGFAAMAGA